MSSADFPRDIWGQVFDKATGYCRLDVGVNVTGNVSDLIWSGTSYNVVPCVGNQIGCCVVYGGDYVSWVVGELITSSSVNADSTGYVGNTTRVGVDGYSMRIDLNLSDVASPRYYGVVLSPPNAEMRRGVSKRVDSFSYVIG